MFPPRSMCLSSPLPLRCRSRALGTLWTLFFLICAIVLPLQVFAQETTEEPETETETENKPDEKEEQEDDAMLKLPIPIGQTSKGVFIQNINEMGVKESVMEAAEARRVSDSEIEFIEMELTLMPPDQPAMTVITDRALFNMKTRLLTSTTPATIKRHDFTMVGETLKFDTSTRVGWLNGNVKVVIDDIRELGPKSTDEFD